MACISSKTARNREIQPKNSPEWAIFSRKTDNFTQNWEISRNFLSTIDRQKSIKFRRKMTIYCHFWEKFIDLQCISYRNIEITRQKWKINCKLNFKEISRFYSKFYKNPSENLFSIDFHGIFIDVPSRAEIFQKTHPNQMEHLQISLRARKQMFWLLFHQK